MSVSEHTPSERFVRDWENGALAVYPVNGDDGEVTGTTLYKFLHVLFHEFVVLSEDIQSVQDALFIKTAKGRSLDRHGAVVGLRRFLGETDAKFRKRIIAAIRAGATGTTIPETIRFAAFVFDTTQDNIGVTWEWEQRPHTAIIEVASGVIDNATLTRSEIAAYLETVAPAGGDIIIRLDGSFILKAPGASNDPDKGLTGAGTDRGGTLAGVLDPSGGGSTSSLTVSEGEYLTVETGFQIDDDIDLNGMITVESSDQYVVARGQAQYETASYSLQGEEKLTVHDGGKLIVQD